MLKILEKKDEIIDAVKNNDTVIIKSEPGTGKTTQVPQFLYDAGMRVIVVEPRMLEAYQSYKYVVKQRGLNDQSNTTIGCRTKRVYKNVNNFGILYCVGGFHVINNIKKGENIENTVIIIDEAHEWKLPQEIVMGWINTYRSSGNKLKVVFMSASISPAEIENYYKNLSDVALIEISGMQYPVSKHTLLSYYDAINVALTKASVGKSVLFFCSGKNEIEETIKDLKSTVCSYDNNFDVEFVPLHGNLSFEEQERAFQKTNFPKVVVCTNICQSGVTPPIDVVIDNGHEKQMRCINGIDTLVEVLISEEDCRQREGRAGRIEKGEYYRLLSNTSDDRNRPQYPIPEIQRLSLDKTVMKLIDMGIDPYEMQFFHQPSKEVLDNSFELLEDLGAVEGGKITEIGRKMVMMPLSMQFARILVEAEKLGCMSEAIKAVAIMEVGSLLNARYIRSNFYDYSHYTNKCYKSDLIAEIDIFDQISNNIYGKDLKQNGISKRNYSLIRNRIRNLRKLLSDQGYDVNTKASEFDLISCLFSGMYKALMYYSHGSSYAEKDDYMYDGWNATYASATNETISGFCIGMKQIIARKSGEPLKLLLFRTALTEDETLTLLCRYTKSNIHIDYEFIEYLPQTKKIKFKTEARFNNMLIQVQTVSDQVDKSNTKIYNLFKDEIIKAEKEWERIKNNQFKVSFDADHKIEFQIASADAMVDTTMAMALKKCGAL